VGLEIHPPSVNLASRRDRVQLVVTGRTSRGGTRDLTHLAKLRCTDDRVASVDGTRVVPVANGEADLTVEAEGLHASVRVVVDGQDGDDPVRFKYEALAVLTRQGCNSGSCHGSPQGKGGFTLSLFAYAPSIDRDSLVRGDRGRRVNFLRPEDSLFLKKPTLRVSHVGGRRLHEDSLGFGILRDWVQQGANTDFENESRCVDIEVSPSLSRVLRFGAAAEVRQQLRVVARFADGSSRDVPGIVTYSCSQDEIASVDANGVVRGKRRGQAAVSVRYLEKLASVRFTFVRDVPGFEWSDGENPATDPVDRLVNAKLQLLRISASPICSDSVFLRRAHLDLTGLLPTVREARAFLADDSPGKRTRLVDRLLETESFARYWGQKRADLLRVDPDLLSTAGAELYGGWIVDSVRRNMPSDEFARRLLTASAEISTSPEAGYLFTGSDPATLTETTAQLFMGSRVNCAKCHNHPFEAWTQDDYYHIAAVFARVRRDGDPKKNAGAASISVAMEGEVKHPVSGRVMEPWPVDGAAGEAGKDTAGEPGRRARFASWLTSPENPYFARVEVNRVWAELFGRGIVDPVDDFRSSNPASNQELLDFLARELVDHGFDRKHVLRLILHSRVYQRSTRALSLNRDDERLGSHMIARLLTAEQLQDALTRVCTEGEGAGADMASRFATQRVLPERSELLVAFGAPARKSPCACERSTEPTLPQLLQLMNGREVAGRVRDAVGRFEKSADLVEELYLAAFSRPPGNDERERSEAYLASRGRSREAIQDLVWAVVNTREFLFQH